jgi:hypothetical protein
MSTNPLFESIIFLTCNQNYFDIIDLFENRRKWMGTEVNPFHSYIRRNSSEF